MLEEVIAAGFGGQGVMLIGQILAYSAIKEGKNATWVPSYGAEMRGGTANCLCVISTEEVGSPLVKRPTTLFCMNQPSMDKFGPSVQPGGLIIANKSLVSTIKASPDVKIVEIPLRELAQEIGSSKIENMIMLGAYIAQKPVISMESAIASCQDKLGAAKTDMNRKAIELGYSWVKEHDHAG